MNFVHRNFIRQDLQKVRQSRATNRVSGAATIKSFQFPSTLATPSHPKFSKEHPNWKFLACVPCKHTLTCRIADAGRLRFISSKVLRVGMIPSESLAFFSQKFLRVGKRAVSRIFFLHFSMPWTTINLYCFTLNISAYAGNDKFHINVIEWHAHIVNTL